MESVRTIANPVAAAPGGGDDGRRGGDRGRGGRGGPKKAKRNRNLCTYCKRRGHGWWQCDFYNGLRAMGRQFYEQMNRGRGRGRGRGSAQRGRGRGGLLARGGHQGQLPGGQNQPLSAEANAGQIEAAPAPQPEQAQDPVADLLAAISTLSEEERVRFLMQALAATNQPLPGHGEEPKDGQK
ncbi:hypothetical protein DTO207G8_215 [Paecilomyces variotii]|nr:hypothetical protein DTO169E5_3166 [Paecilomyces variotii]KAJ9261065.1 hypothetical protein DTO207G8_215 [Paecilomyces variotii]